ncbi:hypothetical protein ACOSP7_018100 [Xanthoceras sorbifolium]
MTSHLGPNHLSVRVSLVDHLYSSQASSDSGNVQTSIEYSHDGMPRISGSSHKSRQKRSCTFDLCNFSKQVQTCYATLSDNLSTFEIDEEHIDATIEAIISLGRQIIDRNRSESNTSSKLLTVITRKQYVIENYESYLMHRAARESMEDESSVKTLLKRVRVEEAAATGDGKKQESNKKLVSDDESQMNCSIRMEQLWAGTYATAMPCLHVYHGDCIVQWLKQSHFCPLCRYEMPTDN